MPPIGRNERQRQRASTRRIINSELRDKKTEKNMKIIMDQKEYNSKREKKFSQEAIAKTLELMIENEML